MSNAYGLETYRKYREETYKINGDTRWKLVGLDWLYMESYKIEFRSYCREDDYADYKKEDVSVKLRHEMTVYKNGLKSYECKDIFRYLLDSKITVFFRHNSNDFLMFRKDCLYGYTILNLDTLEERNYFPSDVADCGKESFIIAGAMRWNDVLLLDGCYWAGPSMCCLLDLNTYKTYLIDAKEWRSIAEHGIIVKGDLLTLRYDDEESPPSSSYTYEQILKLLAESDSYDL